MSRFETENDRIPDSLPLLEYVSDMYSLRNTQPFKGYKILAVQHLLGASLPLFETFEKGGADPEDIHIVGKAYSSHPLVVESLQRKGYNLDFAKSFEFIEGLPYDTILERNILSMINNISLSDRMSDKYLLIDDGGKAIRMLNSINDGIRNRISCVEQTSRGANLLQGIPLYVPVVNVARSHTKTIYESPSIAKAMVDEFLSLRDEYKRCGILDELNNQVALVGYGFIGENVANRLLAEGFELKVSELDIQRRSIAVSNGLAIVENYRNSFTSAGIIIGTTGGNNISEADLNNARNGVMLANMASSDIEFGAWDLRPRGIIVHQNRLPSDEYYLNSQMPLPWRSLYKVNLHGKNAFLMNGGFPTDFSGKINPIPIENIQLTSALLLGGVVQAVRSRDSGLQDLTYGFQKEIFREYSRLTGTN